MRCGRCVAARPSSRAPSAEPRAQGPRAREAQARALRCGGWGTGEQGQKSGLLLGLHGLCTHPFCARELAGAILRLESRVAFACCLTGLFRCLQVLFPIRICDSLNVRFWPRIFQRPPWHFSALEVVFPSFSVFSCISIGVFRRPLSLQCPCTDAVFLGFSAKIDLRGPESSWRALKNRRPALPLNGHLRKTLPASGIRVF